MNDIEDGNWPAKLAAEHAMGYDSPEVMFLKSGQPREIYDAVVRSEEFKLAVAAYKRELDSGPNPLKMKAKRMLWETMGELVLIAKDDEVNPSDRIAAIREIAKLSGETAETPVASATAVVQIVRFSDTPKDVVSVQ